MGVLSEVWELPEIRLRGKKQEAGKLYLSEKNSTARKLVQCCPYIIILQQIP